MIYEQSTTSNEGSDQISAQSDGLIESYGIADRNPRRGDINFLPSDRSPHLPRPFLLHFFVDPRLLGLVLIPWCWASVRDPNGWQWLPRLSFTHSGKHNCFLKVSYAGYCRGTRYRHAIGLKSYRVLFTIQFFILKGISRFYPFTSDSSAGHYLKPPNFGLVNRGSFGGATSILEWSWVLRYFPILPIKQPRY